MISLRAGAGLLGEFVSERDFFLFHSISAGMGNRFFLYAGGLVSRVSAKKMLGVFFGCFFGVFFFGCFFWVFFGGVFWGCFFCFFAR